MSLVIPDAAAMSSIEVAAYPVRAKAAAAPCRIDSWRAGAGERAGRDGQLRVG